MSELPSIRRRLSRALVIVSLVWGVSVSVVVWLVVGHEVDEIMDATLQEAAEVLYGLLLEESDALPHAVDGVLPAPPHKERLSWQLLAPGPTLLLRSHRAPRTPIVGPQSRGFATVDLWRVYAIPMADAHLLIVAQPMAERSEARLEAAQYTAGAALAVGLVCAAWLSLRVRRELVPVLTLSQDVKHYDPLQPLAVLAPAQRAELEPMHHAVTELGTRLAQRVRGERAFSAHAAHALRTPLAGVVAQLAAAQRFSSPEAQPMLLLARQAADRLRRVVGALLSLFRTGADLRWGAVDLPQLAAQLPVEGLQVTVDTAPGLLADADLLAAALANLLDNAARHGAHAAHLSAHCESGVWHVVLSDDGPGVDAARQRQLQAAIDAQDYEGATGLGLMLADRVARAHGGGLRLACQAGGCRVELSWPVPGPPQPGARPA